MSDLIDRLKLLRGRLTSNERIRAAINGTHDAVLNGDISAVEEAIAALRQCAASASMAPAVRTAFEHALSTLEIGREWIDDSPTERSNWKGHATMVEQEIKALLAAPSAAADERAWNSVAGLLPAHSTPSAAGNAQPAAERHVSCQPRCAYPRTDDCDRVGCFLLRTKEQP